MANFGPLAAEIVSLVWGAPANFNGFRVLASLLQQRGSTEANQTLHDVWPSPARLHYRPIHFWRLLPGNGICQVQNSVCVLQVLRSPNWQRYCTALEQWARAKLCGVEHRAPPIFGRATITLGIGPHSIFLFIYLFTSDHNGSIQKQKTKKKHTATKPEIRRKNIYNKKKHTEITYKTTKLKSKSTANYHTPARY